MHSRSTPGPPSAGSDTGQRAARGVARVARRQDVDTFGRYAWALYANGRRSEAREIMRRALAVGFEDPDVLAHAAAIGK